MRLLAVDPGLNSPGAAFFHDKRLSGAARFNTKEFADQPDGQRWLSVARVLVGWALKFCGGPDNCLHVIFERPQFYARGKSKGDPNKLAGLTGVAGNLTGMLSRGFNLTVASPNPADWIGQVPKTCHVCKENLKKCPHCHGSAWNTPRGQFIVRRLDPAELALVPDQNDAIDAVGLGLFELGRLTPRSVFSNGRDGR